jgi:hypothetical protein
LMFRKYGYSIGGIGHEISGISSLLALSNVPSLGTSTYVKFSQTLPCLSPNNACIAHNSDAHNV